MDKLIIRYIRQVYLTLQAFVEKLEAEQEKPKWVLDKSQKPRTKGFLVIMKANSSVSFELPEPVAQPTCDLWNKLEEQDDD